MAPTDVPAGFKPLNRHDGGFIDQNGPLWIRRDPQNGVEVGFRVEPRHCNPMNICHGGMLSTFCDMLLPITAIMTVADLRERFLPTISLQTDFMAPAKVGAWVQGVAEVMRTTRSLVFVQGLVTADGELAVRTSGVFKIGPEFKRG